MSSDRVLLAGGQFLMGSNRHYPEERPERLVSVLPFRISRHPVRNQEFGAFVQATGYTTVAERLGHSHVFQMTQGPVPLNDPARWWKAQAGACWKDPQPGLPRPSDFAEHPVVHIALEDAKAYAAWVGGSLPTEAQWEFAARGGGSGTEYAWGHEFAPAGQRMAHVWQGAFPWYYAPGGLPGTLKTGQFAANGYGLFDLIGNVWEWTCSSFSEAGACCSCSPEQDSRALWTLKGGSYLCAAEYCLRYRPAARMGLAGGSTTSHVGFRCVWAETTSS